jgi:uncharacterized protein with NAD-binding domain and iron-sulfur cluster
MPENASDGPTRVAIFGGGSSACSTAFWLSSTPELRERFKVTLWTRGWRLGGKGASGRDAAAGRRIQEHGLHIWLGFYQNAFTTMRSAFEALQPPPIDTFTSIETAFRPVYETIFMERVGSDDQPDYEPWAFPFLPHPGQPGDPMPKPFPMAELVKWLDAHIAENISPNLILGDWNVLLNPLARAAQRPMYPGMPAEPSASGPTDQLDAAGLRLCIEALQNLLAVAMVPGLSTDLRRALILASLGLSVLHGYVVDLLPYLFSRAAYNRLDALDFRAWLKLHGASEQALSSAPLQGFYDLAFSYPGGDTRNPLTGSMAAGVTLRLAEELVLGYRNAPFFKMNAGMGDTIFTPLHDALIAQGVTVNLFHAVMDVTPRADGASIEAIELRRQAEVAVPPYKPFVSVQGRRCWPAEPDWSQLVDGGELEARGVRFEATEDTTSAGPRVPLLVGRDFDLVVLAMPPDALASVTGKLRANPAWAAMLDNSSSVATVGIQLWLKPDAVTLGFPGQPSPSEPRIASPAPSPPSTSYVEPLATFADMSHLLPAEDWPAPGPQSIAYFCGPMPLPPLEPGGDDPLAEALGSAWLKANIHGLWSGVLANGDLTDVLVSSFFRANTDPSERYVLVLPGSLDHRLAPDSRPFSNLYVAGDWTRLPVSGGCVETAMQSGMVVARAITGANIPIDDH